MSRYILLALLVLVPLKLLKTKSGAMRMTKDGKRRVAKVVEHRINLNLKVYLQGAKK